MSARRELWTWAALCAAGAGLVLLAAGRGWAEPGSGATWADDAGPSVLTGSAIVPFLGPVALAALAAVVAVLATGGAVRRAVGVVIALCGLGVLAGVWYGVGRGVPAAVMPDRAAGEAAGGYLGIHWVWPAVAAAGGLLLLAAGAVAAARGPRWPGMSRRYDRRGHGGDGPAGGPVTERVLWDAIDRGADPTADPEDRAP
ncbi:Trp biosynthesis-associated membrane protein [Planomonospora corallina]|uniref:Trp biosynthesis-associated membrane protein n=1 Tax=Planomonospora corallina TaxID=1806052 RepID=A0ABV8IAH7_9ACTN